LNEVFEPIEKKNETNVGTTKNMKKMMAIGATSAYEYGLLILSCLIFDIYPHLKLVELVGQAFGPPAL
jgi:hypothetical protein